MKVSLFAYTADVTGLSLKGMLYLLEDARLEQNFPLGVSNEITAPEGEISFNAGRLLVMLVPAD